MERDGERARVVERLQQGPVLCPGVNLERDGLADGNERAQRSPGGERRGHVVNLRERARAEELTTGAFRGNRDARDAVETRLRVQDTARAARENREDQQER